MRPPPLEILGVTLGENTKAKSFSTMNRLFSLLFLYAFDTFSDLYSGALLLLYTCVYLLLNCTYFYLPNDRRA
jgi:hypothetical protein